MPTLELVSSHPFLCKRVAALQELKQPGSAPVVGRNPLAYPLAPLLGVLGGGASGAGAAVFMVVAMIGIMAAIAIPAFIKYKDRAMAMGAGAAATGGSVEWICSAWVTTLLLSGRR